MVRHRSEKLLLMVSLVVLTSQAAHAQVFARHEQAEAVNASCGVRPCPTKILTYGYFHENWRRWPEEQGAAAQARSLSPFAVPDRDSRTESVVPDPRDEASQVIRNRTPVTVAPKDTRSDSSAPAAPPSGDDSNSGTGREFMGLPGDLPADDPAEEAFPSADLPEATDEVFPSTDLPQDNVAPNDADLPEAEEDIFAPDSDPLDDLPGVDDELPGEDEPLDLDSLDLGLNKPKRDHALVFPLMLESSDNVTRQPRELEQVTARDLAEDVDFLMASERSGELLEIEQPKNASTPKQASNVRRERQILGRRNPLRRRVQAQFASQPKVAPKSVDPVNSVRKIAPASYVAPRREKPAAGRGNPLRNR